MLTCKNFFEHLQQYCVMDLPGDDMGKMNLHRRSCLTCNQAYLEEVLRLVDDLTLLGLLNEMECNQGKNEGTNGGLDSSWVTYGLLREDSSETSPFCARLTDLPQHRTTYASVLNGRKSGRVPAAVDVSLKDWLGEEQLATTLPWIGTCLTIDQDDVDSEMGSAEYAVCAPLKPEARSGRTLKVVLIADDGRSAAASLESNSSSRVALEGDQLPADIEQLSVFVSLQLPTNSDGR